MIIPLFIIFLVIIVLRSILEIYSTLSRGYKMVSDRKEKIK
jgi:hypothetical protein